MTESRKTSPVMKARLLVGDLKRSTKATVSMIGRRRREAAIWYGARTLTDLAELTAQWLEGDLRSQPGYAPGYGPDEETRDLIPVLAKLNRCGVLTVSSQPGEQAVGYDGRWWKQRAAVAGFVSPEIARRLTEALPDELTVIVHEPYIPSAVNSAVVTTVDGESYTDFGAYRSPRQVRSEYAICHQLAQDAVAEAYQAIVFDPVWGRNDVLWPALEVFVTAEQAAQGSLK